MAIQTTKFIRKPLYVDAVRITASNFDEIVDWCQGEVQQDEVPGEGTGKKYIKVRVHNPKNPRQTKAFVGDWLLYTERGYKVYTNKAFRASFDKAEVATREQLEKAFGKKGSPKRQLMESDAAITQVEVAPKPESIEVETPQEPGDVKLHSVGPVADTPEPGNGVGEIKSVVNQNDVRREAGLQEVEYVYRDAVSGEYVTEEYAQANPDTTVREQVLDKEQHDRIREIPRHSEEMEQATRTIEAEGGTVEEATPQGIANAVTDTDILRLKEGGKSIPGIALILGISESRVRGVLQTKSGATIVDAPPEIGNGPVDGPPTTPATVEDVAEQEKIVPAAAEGKRVLSVEEQGEMDPEEIRELIKSGEVVLAQDIA